VGYDAIETVELGFTNDVLFANYFCRQVDVEAVVSHAIRVKMQQPYNSPLKQIASHPYLVHYPLEDNKQYFKIDEDLVMASGKFRVLDAMLEKLHARGHRVSRINAGVMHLFSPISARSFAHVSITEISPHDGIFTDEGEGSILTLY